MKKTGDVLLIIGLAISCMFMNPAYSSIVETKHNFSVSGPGTFRAATETEVCKFCHIPHGASAIQPLWNHQSTVQSFTPYNQSVSLTLKSNPGQPDGASKLCLGCHDGTVAVGSLGTGGVVSGLEGRISGGALIGTNLSKSHPVSFAYDNSLAGQNSDLNNPSILTDKVKLDKNGKLQCTSCHNPHDNSSGKFLVMRNPGGEICLNCHKKSGWEGAIHKTAASMNGQGCNTCHKPHGADAVPLLTKSAPDLCYDCHGAQGPAPKNIKNQFLGTSRYTAGLYRQQSYLTSNSHHDVSSGDQSYSGSKMSCGNCHNPHVARRKVGLGGAIESLVDPFNRNNVWDGGGATNYNRSTINFCLKCHSGTFPPSVSNPTVTIAPSGVIINIGTSYLTTALHGSGTVRPTLPENSAPAVEAMSCTVCHAEHGSYYTDQVWNGNVYSIKDTVDGTSYTDNGAKWSAFHWAYVAPTSITGKVKNVRIDPNFISDPSSGQNYLYNLCEACHSVSGGSHHVDISMCADCHNHGYSTLRGGL